MPIAAAISAGASLLGGLFGRKNNSDTNQMNYKIAQMNNEWNERMLDKQLDYNQEMFNQQIAYDQKKMQQQNEFTEYMWNEQNEYNDPSSQMSRMRRAGINPYMALGAISSGNATSSNSSGSGGSPSAQGLSAPQAQHVQMQPYDWQPAFNSLAQSIMSSGMLKKQDAEIKQINAQTDEQLMVNRFKYLMLTAEFTEALSRIKNMDEDTKSKAIMNLWNPKMFQSSLDVQQSQIDVNRSVQALNIVNEKIQQKHLYYIDAETQARIANIVADTSLKYSQKQSQIQSIIESKARTAGINVATGVARATAGAVITESMNNSMRSFYDMVNSMNNSGPRDWRQNMNRERGSLRSTVLTGIGDVLGTLGSFLPKF